MSAALKRAKEQQALLQKEAEAAEAKVAEQLEETRAAKKRKREEDSAKLAAAKALNPIEC